MAKTSTPNPNNIEMIRVEDDDGNPHVSIIIEDDTFFTLHGNNLDTSGLQFYASASQHGPRIEHVTIDVVGKALKKRVRLVANATKQIDDAHLDVQLWLVGLIDPSNYDSLQVLTIPS